MSRRYGSPLDEIDRARLRRVMERLGEVEAAKALGIADRTLIRCIAGVGVYPGTRALVREGLARLEREAA